MPNATGNYLVSVGWEGDKALNVSGTEANATLAAIPVEDKYVFSVVSNSTLSQLAYNSTSKVLSFAPGNVQGTTVYANVTMAKDLIGEIDSMKVYVDEAPIDYTTMSTNTSWIVHFTYQRSAHNISLDLSSPTNPYSLYVVLTIIAFVAGAVIVIWTYRSGYRIKVSKKPEKPKA
jgi:hypothetical protein